KDSQFGKVRVASENFFDPLEFFRLEAMLLYQVRSDGGIGCNGHVPRTLAEVAPHSTGETFSAGSRDRKFVEYGPPGRCLTFNWRRLFSAQPGSGSERNLNHIETSTMEEIS